MRTRELNTIKTLGFRKHPNVPVWKPWFEDMETPYQLGMVHGKEDRADGKTWHLHSGCLMTTEEHNDYREGYSDGWRSERSPMEM